MDHSETIDNTGCLKVQGEVINSGTGAGTVIATDTPLSFWGGFDAQSGMVIDQHHPLKNQRITGKVFVLPEGRGSCTGSVELLEALYAGSGPSAVILKTADEIISLGAVVADEIFNISIPVITLSEPDFELACQAKFIKVYQDGTVELKGGISFDS